MRTITAEKMDCLIRLVPMKSIISLQALFPEIKVSLLHIDDDRIKVDGFV